MTPQENQKYNEYFEKNCRRRGGHKCIELVDLVPLVFTSPLVPENINPPQHLNPATKAFYEGKFYLLKDLEMATITQQ